MVRRAVSSLVALVLATIAFTATASADVPAPSGSSDSGRADEADIDLTALKDLPPDVEDAILSGEATVAPMTGSTRPNERVGGGVSPSGVTPGDCGYSFMWIRNHNPGKIYIIWGFYGLCFLATSYQWNYFVSGPSYWRSDAGGGTLWFRREWTGRYTGNRGGLGWYSGCAKLWAQGSGSASGTACDDFYVSQ